MKLKTTIAMGLLMMSVAACSLFGKKEDEKPEPKATDRGQCWTLPDAAAPEAAQAYKAGVWCASDDAHHSECGKCPLVK